MFNHSECINSLGTAVIFSNNRKTVWIHGQILLGDFTEQRTLEGFITQLLDKACGESDSAKYAVLCEHMHAAFPSFGHPTDPSECQS